MDGSGRPRVYSQPDAAPTLSTTQAPSTADASGDSSTCTSSSAAGHARSRRALTLAALSASMSSKIAVRRSGAVAHEPGVRLQHRVAGRADLARVDGGSRPASATMP